MSLSRRPFHHPPLLEVQGNAKQPLGMSPAHFLRTYWQKHPLLIRQAFPDFTPPLEPNDLAGLACEETSLARLIIQDKAQQRWQVKTSPLQEDDFSHTPSSHWTLLVQDVDKWDADVATLLKSFAFLPSWRIDDIMVSYAAHGGGVSAHTDQYDVFLLQGLGRRRWAISTDPAHPTDFREDVELKQLKSFKPTHEWLLAPGDMLYLPPRIPHDGIAMDDPCMTFSIGMRAPSQAELISDLADYLSERLPDELRYTDPDLKPARRSGEIDRAALNRVKAALPMAKVLSEHELCDWFGRFITRYRNVHHTAPPGKPLSEAGLVRQLYAGAPLLRHPWTRLAWNCNKASVTLYANGDAYPAPAELAQRLCSEQALYFEYTPAPQERELLLALINDGHHILKKPRYR